jgi:hypothetical protein
VTDSASLGIDEYRALLDDVFDQQIVEWTAEAEASERFPRKLIEVGDRDPASVRAVGRLRRVDRRAPRISPRHRAAGTSVDGRGNA